MLGQVMRVALLLAATASAHSGRGGRGGHRGEAGRPKDFTSHEYHEQILNQYVDIWSGDVSLVNSTLAPELTFYIDRFPTGAKGSAEIGPYIKNPGAFASFVEETRTGLQGYGIKVKKWAGEGHDIAIRWAIEIVMGEEFDSVPTTLKAGDPVSYNGTEYLTLDPCTGLIKEIASAQDLISFMYNLGNDIQLVGIQAE